MKWLIVAMLVALIVTQYIQRGSDLPVAPEVRDFSVSIPTKPEGATVYPQSVSVWSDRTASGDTILYRYVYGDTTHTQTDLKWENYRWRPNR